jgi:hypothetical protein
MNDVTRGAFRLRLDQIDPKPSEPDLDDTSVGKWKAFKSV